MCCVFFPTCCYPCLEECEEAGMRDENRTWMTLKKKKEKKRKRHEIWLCRCQPVRPCQEEVDKKSKTSGNLLSHCDRFMFFNDSQLAPWIYVLLTQGLLESLSLQIVIPMFHSLVSNHQWRLLKFIKYKTSIVVVLVSIVFIRPATKVYFHYWFICWLFSQLMQLWAMFISVSQSPGWHPNISCFVHNQNI